MEHCPEADVGILETTDDQATPDAIANLAGSMSQIMHRDAIGQTPFESDETICRKLRFLLSRLTIKNLDSTSRRIISLVGKNENGRVLGLVGRLVVEYAKNDENWPELYVHLCRLVMEHTSWKQPTLETGDRSFIERCQVFGKHILDQCLETSWRSCGTLNSEVLKAADNRAARSAHPNETYETGFHAENIHAAEEAKRHHFLLLKFISELFKLQMVTASYIHEFIQLILSNVDDIHIECGCRLLSEVGKILDYGEDRSRVDAIFSQVTELVNSPNLGARVRFMLQDLIELRVRQWVTKPSPRRSITASVMRLLRRMAIGEQLGSTVFISRPRRSMVTINALPPEILGAIFELGLTPSRQNSVKRATRITLPWQLLLSSVNVYWRIVALNTPQLWTAINLDAIRPKCIPLWIQRSASCLLDVILTVDSYPNTVLDTFEEHVLPHIGRWKSLVVDIITEDNSFVSSIYSRLQSVASHNLRHAEVWVNNRGHDPSAHYHTAPSLKPALLSGKIAGMCLECCPFLRRLNTLVIGREKVSKLFGRRSSYTTFRNILHASPSLKNLVLHRFELRLQATDTFPMIIEIPTLTSLTMDFTAGYRRSSPHVKLFSILSMPALENLEIIGISGPDFATLVQDQSQSTLSQLTQLRSLKIAVCEVIHETLSEFLRQCPVLDTLSVIESTATFNLPDTVSRLIMKSYNLRWIERVLENLKTRRATGTHFTTFSLLVCENIEGVGEPAWTALDPYCHLTELGSGNDAFRFTGCDSGIEFGDNADDNCRYDDWSY
ncbi:ARM repeat-containing protein [Rickenella mellea]|uniref:ARM repeat-containing protein n=1 Tax=Rickenella mellea TaxID=50990 RepID=A0A4R5XI48_9AGAM|nr:ARM repeat-containing protein [Rickenella mellea]